MPSIDVHCHTTPRSLMVELQKVSEGTSPEAKAALGYLQRPNFLDDPQMVGALDERVPLMDGAKLDVQILSTPATVGKYFADIGQRVAATQSSNDEFSAAC